MRVALDKNAYVGLVRGVEQTARLLESADAIVVPFVVIGDLRAGYADDPTTFHYANVFQQLQRQGAPIPMNDMGIAALVIQHNLAFHARDTHFDHLPQIARV